MSADFYNSNSSGVPGSSVSPSCSTSRWISEDVLKLIEMVQRDEAIYNPRHKFYFCRPYVENFWREVDNKLERNTGSSLAKWTNLRISFRREYTNYLEEKIPPCWTYFDPMFFLHPFLRKKQHATAKSLDSQLQDALVQFSSISSRYQRDRGLATTIHSPSNGTMGNAGTHTQQLDSYFEYFDETEHNNSELEDIIDDEQQEQFILPNDIKSECEDAVDDYDIEQNAKSEDNVTSKQTSNDIEATRTLAHVNEKREQQAQQPSLRLRLRHYHDEWRSKRPCSQENSNLLSTRSGCSSAHSHANVSFVRPTFSKNAHSEVSNATGSTITTTPAVLQTPHITDLHSPNIQSLSTSTTSQNNLRSQHRLELAAGSNSSLAHTANNAPSVPAPVELCDCKTDPDAMFLMSLLPDIQKLNGRDRGKIKIAFQNILQDYLYPD